MSSRRQIEANRENGAKGGVKTPEGKAISRLNARKHGIFCAALTKQDRAELSGVQDEIADCLQPVGLVEEMVVDKIAQTYLRLHRCAWAEAESWRLMWHDASEHDVATAAEVRSARAAALNRASAARAFAQPDAEGDEEPDGVLCLNCFEHSMQVFGRYDRGLTYQFIRLLHELERLQRMRRGERVPPPIAGEVAVELEGEGPEICGYKTNPISPIALPAPGLRLARDA